MELFQHNKYALEQMQASFAAGNRRAAVVHPTGTGKSYIIAALILARPEDRILVLSPSNFISAQIQKLIPEGAAHFLLYAGVGVADTADLEKMSFDLIILDEFHRAGAPIWQAQVEIILQANPNAHVAGFSATHIRHLDEGRNMATELFGGNVVSELSLEDCFAQGILNAPKYVTAIYSLKDIYEKHCAHILKYSEGNKLLVNQFKRRIIDWEKTKGLFPIIQKHLTNDYKRIIVFAGTLKRIGEIRRAIMPAIREAHEHVKEFKVHSVLKREENEETFAAFGKEDAATHVLFCVDMLNEGIHVKGVNAVILCRETISPTIYRQQIGRAFSAGDESGVRPLVLDLVNNFKSAAKREFAGNFYTSRSETWSAGFQRGTRQKVFAEVEFIDETQELADLLRNTTLEKLAVEKWYDFYSDLKKFHKKNGHINAVGILGTWIIKQRTVYNAGEFKDPEKISLLNALGMDWSKKFTKESFEFRVQQFLGFIEENDCLPFSRTLKGTEHQALAVWFFRQQKKAQQGLLSKENADLFQPILDIHSKYIAQRDDEVEEKKRATSTQKAKRSEQWSKSLQLYLSAQEGEQEMTETLQKWWWHQRVQYRKGKLSDERLNNLISAGLNVT